MSGNSQGAQKAAQTNKQKYGADFYSKIGQKSWNNPNRSHKTGFALLPVADVIQHGSNGGKKTKSDYKTTLSSEAFEEKIKADADLLTAETDQANASTGE